MAEADKKQKSSAMNYKQKDMLVEFISSREEMYSGKLTTTYTREKMETLWKELSAILNSIPGGSCKDWKQWRKTWVDLKKNTKSKISCQKKHSQGGPPPTSSPMTSIEEKFFNILTPVAVSGNVEISESVVEFEELIESDHLQQTDVAPNSEIKRETADIVIDHNYHQATPSTSINKPSLSTTNKRKRISKSTRLSESIKNNEIFLKLQEEEFKSMQWYRKRKIEILEAKYQNKKETDERNERILKDISNSLNKVFNVLAEKLNEK